MDNMMSTENQRASLADPEISILSYNVLFSTHLDLSGPDENFVNKTGKDGKIELHLRHGLTHHHGVDFKIDFPDGKYSETIPMDMLEKVKTALEKDEIGHTCIKTNIKTRDTTEESFCNDEDIDKLKKYYFLYEESMRYSRLEKRLEKEIIKYQMRSCGHGDFYRPIICLTEVSRKWKKRLQIFFNEHDYRVEFAENHKKPKNDNSGLLMAYPSERYELLQIQKDSPFRDFKSVPTSSIRQLKKELDNFPMKTKDKSNLTFPVYSEEELGEIIDAIIEEASNPFMFSKFKLLSSKANDVSADEKEFVLGAYHLPMKVHWKTKSDTPAGPVIMGTYAFAIRWHLDLFLRKFAQNIRESKNVILCGDFNIQPRTVRFQYLMNGKVGDVLQLANSSSPDTSNDSSMNIDPNYCDASQGIPQDEKLVTDRIIKELFDSNTTIVQNLLQEAHFEYQKGNQVTWCNVADESLTLEHVYKNYFGRFPEMTTKTQKFLGSIDHFFKAVERRRPCFTGSNNGITINDENDTNNESERKGMETLNVRKMPSAKEMQNQSCPNFENEPSDHFCQGAVFKFK